MRKKDTDILIPLAWPDALVTRNSMRYDIPFQWIGFCRNNKYRVGHAAVLLIERSSGTITYFDCGRYGMPTQQARIRSMETDPALEVPFKAEFSKDWTLKNLESILTFSNNHKQFHAEGKMLASVFYGASYKKWVDYSHALQSQWVIPYWPFIIHGSNCSRFVNNVCRQSYSCRYTRIRWRFPRSWTPSTWHNITVNENYFVVDEYTVRARRRPAILWKWIRHAKSATA